MGSTASAGGASNRGAKVTGPRFASQAARQPRRKGESKGAFEARTNTGARKVATLRQNAGFTRAGARKASPRG